jgi:Asp-tRNA(Asn)/Glu-tRNA(Gln) amidotransferase A subunit family amidase
MIMLPTDPTELSATEAIGLMAGRKLSPLELMTAIIARAETVELVINAFTDRYFEQALDQAATAEARYANGTARPLEGLPLAVKDAQRVAGQRTTQGSLIFMDGCETQSDPMIERLLAAGVIVHARTAVPEFCLSGVCHSRAWGVTRNPHHPSFGPGGSSGGSAASIAAGSAMLATGTDIGGSIRIPASACGVIGFKPPHGRNPDGPPACFDPYNHCGPITRCISDAALMQSVTAGQHPLDHDSLPNPPELPREASSIAGLKVAWSMDLGYMAIDPEVRRNTLMALDVLRSLGCVVSEVDVGWTSDVEKDGMHWYNAMHFGRQTIWHAREHSGQMTDYALRFAEVAARTTLDDMTRSWERRHIMAQSFGPILAAHDVFVCPTLAVPAVAADHDPWDNQFQIDGVKVDPEFGWVLTQQFNMLHHCPVLSVPSGHARNGVPTGMQIVGRTFDDATVFRVGLAVEAARGLVRPVMPPVPDKL